MLSTYHPPYDARIYDREAKSLKKAGYDVTVVGQTKTELREKTDGIEIIGFIYSSHQSIIVRSIEN
jgi:hypothetical protein